jgi:hypothetical protein
MTQPPGPYGPYGQPAEPNRPTPPPPPGQSSPYPPPSRPYGQPAPYGPPPTGQQPNFGQPAYGPPPQAPGGFPAGGYGQPPQPPEKKGLLPWLIVGLAVLVSGVGVALVFLLTGKDDDSSSDNQAATSSSSSSSSSSASPSADHGHEPAGDLPGGAQVVVPDNDGGGQFEGSGDVALAWVQALADGDFQTAYDMSCAEVQDAAATASVGGTEDPAWELATYFYEQTLGGVGFTEGTFDSVTYQETSNQDMAAFTLQLDNGDTFTLLVYVGPDLTVCDFF